MILETMIWVAVIVIAAILEGMSAQLISIWFVGGGIAGMIAAYSSRSCAARRFGCKC